MPVPWGRGALVGLLAAGTGLICFAVASRRMPVAGEPAVWPGPLWEPDPADDERDRHRRAIVQRNLSKEEATRELLAGRLPLLQAAARFRAADAAVPAQWRFARGAQASGLGEGERLCREVIARARVWLASEGSPQAADVLARLEAELERLRDKDGTIRLPD